MDARDDAEVQGVAWALTRQAEKWRRAIQMQSERYKAYPLASAAAGRWIDIELFVISLRNLLRACHVCRWLDEWFPEGEQPFADAVQAFETAIPHARDIRDRLEHFDQYEMDFDHSVWIAFDGTMDFEIGPEGISLHINDFRMELELAVAEAERMATAVLAALTVLTGRLQVAK